eukprot:1240206-Rhodomonas_salina.2
MSRRGLARVCGCPSALEHLASETGPPSNLSTATCHALARQSPTANRPPRLCVRENLHTCVKAICMVVTRDSDRVMCGALPEASLQSLAQVTCSRRRSEVSSVWLLGLVLGLNNGPRTHYTSTTEPKYSHGSSRPRHRSCEQGWSLRAFCFGDAIPFLPGGCGLQNCGSAPSTCIHELPDPAQRTTTPCMSLESRGAALDVKTPRLLQP